MNKDSEKTKESTEQKPKQAAEELKVEELEERIAPATVPIRPSRP